VNYHVLCETSSENTFFVVVEYWNSWSLHSKIASNEATVGVSTAKGGETTEGSLIASNEVTVELFEIT